jgi:hypothetical protein
MKKILSVMCGLAVATSLFAAKAKGPVTLNVWSFTDEVPGMIEKYIKTHPDCGFDQKVTIIATTNQEYEPALIPALQNGEVDIYAAEAAFVLKYTKGDMSDYAAPYKDLGIKIDKAVKDAEIAQYTIDIGSNNKGQIVGLGYQATGGCFIYNRTVAKKVFGSDDPKVVEKAIGGGTQSYTKFWEAAQKCADNGVAIISGEGDLWHAFEVAGKEGWVNEDNKLVIDPAREEFFDAAKRLNDNGYTNKTQDWTEAWFADMQEKGAKPCLGFFGPGWLVNYSMSDNCGGKKVGEGTYGDWAVCQPPVGFFWGGTWVLASKAAAKDKAKRAAAKAIIEWITLDTSKDGLLYQWANGTFQWKYGKGADPTSVTKDVVSSAKVMKISNGSVAFLGGQNQFDYFIPAGKYASGKTLGQYDSDINAAWRDQVRQYVAGNKTKDQAIKDFKQKVSDTLGIDID